jgi:hypothetical protein
MGSPITFGVTKFGIYRLDNSTWTLLNEIPILTDSIYQIIVPTLIDSTGANPQYWSTFRIIAYTENQAIYTIIGPDSGYSVSNNYWPIGVQHASDDIPESFGLSQNYPNPFNPSTTITYQIPYTSNVIVEVYDVLGRKVTTLVNETKEAGNYSLNFKAPWLSSGIYFYKLTAGTFTQVKHMMLTK